MQNTTQTQTQPQQLCFGKGLVAELWIKSYWPIRLHDFMDFSFFFKPIWRQVEVLIRFSNFFLNSAFIILFITSLYRMILLPCMYYYLAFSTIVMFDFMLLNAAWISFVGLLELYLLLLFEPISWILDFSYDIERCFPVYYKNIWLNWKKSFSINSLVPSCWCNLLGLYIELELWYWTN